MTITLELEPSQVEALTHRSAAKEDEVETVLYQWIASRIQENKEQQPAVLSEKQQAAIALLHAWTEEEATPEERAKNDAEYEQFKANINRWRAEEGVLRHSCETCTSSRQQPSQRRHSETRAVRVRRRLPYLA